MHDSQAISSSVAVRPWPVHCRFWAANGHQLVTETGISLDATQPCVNLHPCEQSLQAWKHTLWSNCVLHGCIKRDLSITSDNTNSKLKSSKNELFAQVNNEWNIPWTRVHSPEKEIFFIHFYLQRPWRRWNRNCYVLKLKIYKDVMWPMTADLVSFFFIVYAHLIWIHRSPLSSML